ncbi:MAG: lysylphosphatidylglycerol synthase transmembrane domain-containing protein [Patulibacter minatonensis]
MIVASILDDFSAFFSNLSKVHLGPLLIGMVCFVAYLSLRALAFRNILAAAFPEQKVPYRQMWGAYLAAYGFNNVIPARGGDVLKVYLTKTSIPTATYPTIGAALLVEAIFDLCAGGVAVLFAIATGVFPDPPSWVSLDSVDLSFVVSDGRRALFIITAVAIALIVMFALVALRVRAFWQRVRQGFAVLQDRRRYLRTVWGIQGIGWLVRGTAFFFFLKAFGMPATVGNVFLVLTANAVAAIFPFTPGGAGVVQAMLLELFKGAVASSVIAAYGVGVQATIAILSLGVGFLALVWVFEIRSFREVIERGRADREAERAAERAAARSAEDLDVTAVAGTAAGAPPADDTLWQGPAGPAPSAAAATDDWLAEELASDHDRDERRPDRWRRRGGR